MGLLTAMANQEGGDSAGLQKRRRADPLEIFLPWLLFPFSYVNTSPLGGGIKKERRPSQLCLMSFLISSYNVEPCGFSAAQWRAGVGTEPGQASELKS